MFIPEYPPEEGWEDTMCVRLSEVISNMFEIPDVFADVYLKAVIKKCDQYFNQVFGFRVT